ncbi:MAG: hypothetical protein LC721_01105, partial [Actinobacteria bacterium]|nr:hypothetical protein [Actinomycetota bacterium]
SEAMPNWTDGFALTSPDNPNRSGPSRRTPRQTRGRDLDEWPTVPPARAVKPPPILAGVVGLTVVITLSLIL